MAILHRRGAKADFNAQKMLAGEMAVTTDGTRKAYVAFAPGDVKELASKEDVQNIADNFTNSVDKKISEAVEQVTTEAEGQIAAVVKKGEEVLDSIPEDYQEIAEGVNRHETEIAALTQSKSDAITVEKSGTSIVATDSSDKGFEQFRTYGGSKQETTSGKNLLNLLDGKASITGDGVTYTNRGDGSYTIVGTATGQTGNAWFKGKWNVDPNEDPNGILFTLAAGKTYFIKDCILYSNKNSTDAKEGSFTVDRTYYPNGFRVTGVRNPMQTVNAVYNDIIYPRVFEGTEDLGWEPYTGNIPSPNPEYPQPIVSAGQMLVDGVVTDVGISKKLTGKNLLQNTAVSKTVNGVTFTVNNDKSITINGTNDNTNVSDLYIYGSRADNGNYLSIPKGCVASFEGRQNTSVELICREKEITTFTLEQLINLLAERDCQFYGIFLRVTNGKSANTTIYPMIRHADIEDDTYEPYKEQTLTLQTPNGLPGIPLGTTIPDFIKNSPAHMSGVYWDNKEGQYYIADTVDGEKGVRVQRIGVEVNTYAHVNNVYGNTADSLRWAYSSAVQDSLLHHRTTSAYKYVICDRFTLVPSDNTTGTLMTPYGHANNLEFRFRILKSEYPTKEDVVNAVKGTKVYYPLATPIETPLTDEEIIAYKTLHSNKPTTIITNDAGCFMEVEYVADTKTHIAQNYVPVSKYTALEERVSALEQLHV